MVFCNLVRFAAGKRVPLIKFRKGGNAPPAGVATSASSTNQASASSPVAPQKGSSTAIEAWELPQRYCRKPIDPVEIEYINRGGPA